jgi:hypothetical protein
MGINRRADPVSGVNVVLRQCRYSLGIDSIEPSMGRHKGPVTAGMRAAQGSNNSLKQHGNIT